MTITGVTIRPLTEQDGEGVREWLVRHWGDPRVIVHDTVYLPEKLPGFVAEADGNWVGLVTCHTVGDACEIVTLDSIRERMGVGTRLMASVKRAAMEAGCRRVWLVTTNDNLHALGFYQKRGYHLVKVNAGAVDRSRRIKPQIPETGFGGIPIRDELELELILEV